MNVIEGVLRDERKRNLDMQNAYRNELSALPKGYIVIRKRNNKEYCYLNYRDGSRVRTEYVGVAADCLSELEQKIKKRKHLESLIKELNDEYKMICKIVKE